MKKIFLIGILVTIKGFALADIISQPVCTADYSPVCGQKTLYCFKAPCNQPEPKTYANSCNASVDGAKILYQGECSQQKNQNPLENTSWISQVSLTQDNKKAYLEFKDGKVNMSFCNQFGADYLVEGNKINIKNLSSTKMLCDKTQMYLEKNFVLDGARYEIKDLGKTLYITTAQNYEYFFKLVEKTQIDNPYLQKRVTSLQTHLINYQNANNLSDKQISDILKSGVEKIENILMTSKLLPGKLAQYNFQKKVFEKTKEIFDR